MKIKILILLISIIASSCNELKSTKVVRENEPDVYNLEGTDVEMNKAINKANESFNLFEEIFENDKVGKYYFSIKQEYETPNGDSEHIWVGDITTSESNYFGFIGNEPVSTTLVKLDEKVQINFKKISDWMIVDNSSGKVTGGYTIRVLRDRMSKEERAQFDQYSGLLFE